MSSFIMGEVERLARHKDESVRMKELFYERRLSSMKKTKVEDFCAWKREVAKERKRMKREEKGYRMQGKKQRRGWEVR